MLPDTENKKMSKIEFHADWTDIDGSKKYDLMELKTDKDLKVM